MSNVGNASTNLAYYVPLHSGGLVQIVDLGPGIGGGAAEMPPAPPLSLAERKAAALAMIDALEAEERAAEPHPLALAVRRTDTFSQGVDQRTGLPRWAVWR